MPRCNENMLCNLPQLAITVFFVKNRQNALNEEIRPLHCLHNVLQMFLPMRQRVVTYLTLLTFIIIFINPVSNVYIYIYISKKQTFC